jgi:MoaA/NifB/PqqE/SkfB family radical SAM enzyme
MKRTVSFSKNAANLFFHILTRCNLHCRHCYINPRQHGRKTLSLATIEAWLEAFEVERGQANVIFLGGEPTLHPDLPQAIRHAKALGYGSVTVDTNGYLFYNFLEKIDPSELDYLSFSLDGASALTNDALRGKGSFARCLDGMGKAKARGFAVSLIYTVSSANLEELAQMPSLIRQNGVDRFFIQVIGLRGQSAAHNLPRSADAPGQVPRSLWLDAVAPVARQVAELGVTVTYPKVFLAPGERFECAGRVADNYFIFPNGRVYRCPLCEDFPLHGLEFKQDQLCQTEPINEDDLFGLNIAEGCVMNKLIQPGNLEYGPDGKPLYQIACCLLKEEITRG